MVWLEGRRARAVTVEQGGGRSWPGSEEIMAARRDGISDCVVILLICVFALPIECQKRKLVKEKKIFFQQNGGLLSYEQIKSKQVDTVRIFTKEELENATNNFDSSSELGRGGHGTVYKGILKDGRVVAIKRSKVMNMEQKDEFAQEMMQFKMLKTKEGILKAANDILQ